MKVVLDTNVIVATMMRPDTAPRQLLRLLAAGRFEAVISYKLFAEYEDVVMRDGIFGPRHPARALRQDILDAVIARMTLQEVYYLWRPNLPDEADNHVLELAIAAGCDAVITNNLRDFQRRELRSDDIEILTPSQFLERLQS